MEGNEISCLYNNRIDYFKDNRKNNTSTLSIDIETYSRNDLAHSGVYCYAESWDFKILLIGYAFDDEEVQIINLMELGAFEFQRDIEKGIESEVDIESQRLREKSYNRKLKEEEMKIKNRREMIPKRLLEALTNESIIKTAFNANFERICLSKYFGIDLKVEQWRCTQVHALSLGLPGNLDAVAKCLKFKINKLSEGKELIRYFSTQNWKDEILNQGSNLNQKYIDKIKLFENYCIRDVEVEREIRKVLEKYPISKNEHILWVLDQRINDRGVFIDKTLIESALECNESYRNKLTNEFKSITNIDKPSSTIQLRAWFESVNILIPSFTKDKVKFLLKFIEKYESDKFKFSYDKDMVSYDEDMLSFDDDSSIHNKNKYFSHDSKILNLKNKILNLENKELVHKNNIVPFFDENNELVFQLKGEGVRQKDISKIKRVLEIRQELSKTSVKKYETMEKSLGKDNRIRGLFKFYGASRTGRWAGKLVQVQNLPQNKLKDLKISREILKNKDYEILDLLFGINFNKNKYRSNISRNNVKGNFQNKLETSFQSEFEGDFQNNLQANFQGELKVNSQIELKTSFKNNIQADTSQNNIQNSIQENQFAPISEISSQLIRTAFIPKENSKFIISDFSAIEARIIAWLSNEIWRIKVFESHGKIYESSASKMFKISEDMITKDSMLRQKGKIAELALGYQGSVNALIQMGALKMGLAQDELKELVDSWRMSNPNIVRLWKTIEKSAITAISKNITLSIEHNLTFYFQSGILFIELPSGRRISYLNARVEIEPAYNKPIITYEGIEQKTKKWTRLKTYGGKLCENIVQAIARDCLGVAMIRLEESGYSIVMHVHDEVVLEVPKYPERHYKSYKNLDTWEDNFKQGNFRKDNFKKDGFEQGSFIKSNIRKNDDLNINTSLKFGTIEHVNEIMGKDIKWAKGLKLKADGFESEYYRK